MVAQLNATDLLQYTHMVWVESWKGTMLPFILHYQEQIQLYDQLQPPNMQTSDHAKLIYLQNAVYVIKELRSVQTTGSQLALANSTDPTYKDYKALLKSVASTYDQAHAPAKRQPTRSAECTDIWDANVTKSFHKAYEFRFDIDTPTDILQAGRNYTAIRTHVRWSIHLSALLITWFTWADGLQRRYASDVAFCMVCFPLTVDNSDMN
jgi:hypothetical protein